MKKKLALLSMLAMAVGVISVGSTAQAHPGHPPSQRWEQPRYVQPVNNWNRHAPIQAQAWHRAQPVAKWNRANCDQPRRLSAKQQRRIAKAHFQQKKRQAQRAKQHYYLSRYY